MEFLKALAAIPEAAASPLGALLFIVTIAAWLALGWKIKRNKNLLAKIESFTPAQRPRIYEMETGRPYLANGLTGEQWIRARTHEYYFYGFLVLLVAAVVMVWLAGTRFGPENRAVASIRVEGPRLIDFRSQMDPNVASAADAGKSEALLTLLAVSYESKDEAAGNARVLEQEVALKLGERMFAYRWFQFADLSKTGKGWLGAEGDAAPFVVGPGDVKPRSTQFKPRTPVTWEEMLAVLKKAKEGEVVLITRLGGMSEAGDVLIRKSCLPDLEKAHRDIADVEKRMNRPPIFLQILCKTLPA